MIDLKRKMITLLPITFLAMLLFAVLAPEVAWANFSQPPGMKLIPPVLIILLPLVMLFTELGGGYKILEAKTPEKFKWVSRWKPILAVLAVISQAFMPLGGVPTFLIVGGVVGFALIRGLRLIGYGLHIKNPENQPAWKQYARPRRLVPAGIAIVLVTVLITSALVQAVFTPNPYKVRAYDSDTKSNLHNIYLACKAYWADSGSSSHCNLEIATLTTYGYIQSTPVVVSSDSGTEQDFYIIAQNKRNKKAFRVDSLGAISPYNKPFDTKTGKIEVGGPKPEKPGLISSAYNELVNIFR